MFSREDTKMIKGIAVILMLAHHIFAFSERLMVGYEYDHLFSFNSLDIYTIIGKFGNICVPIFMFLGGYGLYKKYLNKEGLLKSLSNLFISYWKVFIVFIPVGFILFSNQPNNYLLTPGFCTIFNNFNLIEFFENLIGYSCSYNGEWWFFKNYIFTMILGWIFIKSIDSHENFWKDFLLIVILYIFTQNVFPVLSTIPMFSGLSGNVFYNNFFMLQPSSLVFFIGILFAKYNLYEYIEEKTININNILKTIASIYAIFMIIILRTFTFNYSVDIITVPIFIWLCKNIYSNIKILKSPLKIIGYNSTNMWLIHSFYCYYFYNVVKFVYITDSGIITLVILITISLLSSIILNKFYSCIICLYRKISRFINTNRNY